MEEERIDALPTDESTISAQLLMAPEAEEATEDAAPEAAPDAAQEEAGTIGVYREAMERLMEDGWTTEELQAMAADEDVLGALMQGETLGRAATAYLRRGAQRTAKKRGVPTFRASATAEMNTGDPIAQMSDEEFAAFSRRAKEAALAGLKVRL